MEPTKDKYQANLRRQELCKMLQSQENINTIEAARHFGVNPMTIRRDLRLLEQDGQVKLCYGGALAAQRITFEFEFDERMSRNMEGKRRIGVAAAGLIEPGQTVLLDTGTTTLEIAREVARRGTPCTIITCSLVIASELWGRSQVELILLGGKVRQGSPDLAGPITESLLDRCTADLAFIGADGVDPARGCFINDLEIAGISERMARNARRVVVVADQAKLGQAGKFRFLELSQCRELITDKGADMKVVRALKKNGVSVALA